MIITDTDREKAINYLIERSTETTLLKIYELRQKEGSQWAIPYHRNLGAWIRSILQQAGLDWDTYTLIRYWPLLVEEAARRFVETRSNNIV